MNVSTDLFTATISELPRQSLTESDAAQPTQRVIAVDKQANTNSGGANDSLLASAQQLKQSGASDEDVNAFVSGELNKGDDSSASADQRKGQFVDMYS